VVYIPSEDNFYGDFSVYEDVIADRKINFDKYIEIESVSSNESYKVMEEFIDSLPDNKIKRDLEYAINRAKPFRNFRYELDKDDDLLQNGTTLATIITTKKHANG